MNPRIWLPIFLVAYVVACALLFLPNYEINADNAVQQIVRFLVVTQLLFGLSIAVYLSVRRIADQQLRRRLIYLVITAALLSRAVMLFGPGDKFYLSDDIYRYLWDGKVATYGLNPFLYAPSDEELKLLRDEAIYPNINHSHLPTIYPPAAQVIFETVYWLGDGSTLLFKIVCAIFELLTIALLAIWLRGRGERGVHLILWLLSPLILVEFFLSAHLDILGLPFMVGALIALDKRLALTTGILLALAVLVKFLALIFLPFIFLYYQGRQRLWLLLGFAVTALLFYWPYLAESEGRFLGSLFTYLDSWQYNGSLFVVCKQICGQDPARYLCGAFLMAWLIGLLTWRANLQWKMLAAFGGYLLLTPALFTWYFIWLMPFLLLYRYPAFLLLSSTLLLSYHVLISRYETGSWQMEWWIGVLVYVPFFMLLLWTPARKLFGTRHYA